MAMTDIIGANSQRQKLPDGRDPRTVTVCDPCVGSGRMLLHASNHSVCLYGCDIDPICARITSINGVLYAPWFAFPFSSAVVESRVPAPPPADLPVPRNGEVAEPVPTFRVDDRGQGLLFDLD